MLLTENFWIFAHRHITIQKIFGSSPISIYKSDEPSKICMKTCNVGQLPSNYITLVAFVIYNAVLFVQMVFSVGAFPIGVTLESALYCAYGFVLFAMKWAWVRRRREVAELYNLFLQFEKKHFVDEPLFVGPRLRTLLTGVQWVSLGANVCGVPAFLMQRYLTPCWPATFGNFLNPDCDHFTWPSWFNSIAAVSRFICLGISFRIYMDIIGAFQFQMINLCLLQCCCLIQYLQHFRNSLDNFSIQEDDFGLYHELQVLTRYFNLVEKNVVLPSIVGMFAILFTGSLYILVKFGTEAEVPLLILSVIQLSDGILGIYLVLGTFAKLHENSTEVLAFMKNKLIPMLERRSDRMKVGKVVKSFSVLKVRLGEVNFVDKVTPLTVIEFCCQQLVSMLLI